LRGSGRFTLHFFSSLAPPPCLNPLHCGAVVASTALARRSARSARCLNPLHCGAVVASVRPVGVGEHRHPTSQSPSLRGSGRFPGVDEGVLTRLGRLNPLHCGAVVASLAAGWDGSPKGLVSIPFIAGQWSLLAQQIAACRRASMSQSPSLRGSGRFRWFSACGMCWSRSQSPSLRGSGRFHSSF